MNFVNLTPIKRIFLLDAFGALLSTLSLGIVLPFYRHFIQLPLHTLYVLATVATILFIYSFSCYLRTLKYPTKWLKLLVFFNISYAFYTLSILWSYWHQISLIGIAYFATEIIILILLVRFEWKSSLK